MSFTDTSASTLSTRERLPWWTRVLTVFLIFHLAVLLITPNKENYFGYRLFKVLEPYVNLFEFSADWTFFSPDPAPPLYFEWKAFDQGGNELRTGAFPELKGQIVFGDRQIRRISAARFMLLRDGNVQNSLLPYVCGAVPNAFSVRISRVLMYPPRMIDIIQGKKDVTDISGYDRADLGLEFCDNGSKSI